jgi:NAD(P)-dependent dehydrogenase (short-subunit alcohol dehydrogenase family)
LVAAQSLREEGIDASPLQLDVTSRDSIGNAARHIANRYGVLDSLVNNAGISLERGEGRENLDPMDLWRRTLETNIVGVVAVTQALLSLLLKSAAGRIVQVSSVMGSLTLHADPTSRIYEYKSAPAYDASKAALNSFTIHLAYELRATPIKVNAAHPGWVKTGIGGDDAPLELYEGAQTGAWLATLPADGPTGYFYHLSEVVPW